MYDLNDLSETVTRITDQWMIVFLQQMEKVLSLFRNNHPPKDMEHHYTDPWDKL